MWKIGDDDLNFQKDYESIFKKAEEINEKIKEEEMKKEGLLKKILKYKHYEDKIENIVKEIKLLVGEHKLNNFRLEYKKVNVENLTNECKDNIK